MRTSRILAGYQNLKNTRFLVQLSNSPWTGAIWLIWWLEFRARRKQRSGKSVAGLVFELATVVIVAFTGHIGGFLSGVNSPR
jgi:hypothetical protein